MLSCKLETVMNDNGGRTVFMKRKHILTLVALCLIFSGSMGLTTNIAGLFTTPIANDFGVGRGDVSLAMTIASLTGAAGGMAFPRLLRKNNFKLLLILASSLTVGSLLLMSVCNQLWLYHAANVIRGFSTGFTGTVMVTMVVNNWFFKSNGLFNSIVMGCSGVSCAIFSPIFSNVITRHGWRAGYIASAIVVGLMLLPMILLKTGVQPEDVGEIPYGGQVNKAAFKLPEKKPKLSVKLLLLCFLYSALGGTLTAVAQHFPGVADSYMLPAAVGAAMLSATMITNTSGKILLGFLTDRIGLIRSALIVSVLTAGGVVMIAFLHSGTALIIGAALAGLMYSLVTVGVVTMTRETFGLASYGSAFSKITFGCSLAYALSTAGVGYLYDLLHSYQPIFYMMLVILAVMTLITFVVYGSKDRVLSN